MKLYSKDDQNITDQFREMIDKIADARDECKLMLIGVQNAVDHGTPTAQVIIFRDRTPKDGLMVLKK